jgi:glycosyltransferase involved in cell wall biosynthesis
MPENRQKVVMLVNNPCVNDSRVIKEAEAIAASGRWVAVVCQWCEGLPRHEQVRGVEYYRIDTALKTPRQMIRTLMVRMGLSSSPGNLGHGEEAHNLSLRWPSISFISSRSPISQIKKSIVYMRRYPHVFLPFYPIYWMLSQTKRLIGYSLRASMRNIYWLTEFEDFGLAAERAAVNLDPEVVHAHDLATLPTGSRVARKCGARLIYDSHELEMHRNSKFPWYVWRRRRFLERRYIRKANAVITVSDSIADHLAADYGILRPVVIVNAPNPPAGDTSKEGLRQKLGLKNEPIAVYVGSVTVHRGIEQCVRALTRIQNLRFALVGPRRPITEREITQLAERLGVRNRLFLVDPVPPDDVVSFISSADVSVVPIQDVCLSYRYCLPNKLFESAFAGLPIAASDFPELRRFIDRSGCGVTMDQADPDDIAEKIQFLLNDPTRYRLSLAEQAVLLGIYGWPVQAKKLCNLYDNLAGDFDAGRENTCAAQV